MERRLTLLLWVWLLTAPPGGAALAAEVRSLTLPELTAEVRALTLPELVAEPQMVYDIAFLWFDRLAEGRANFSAGDRPGTYRATLEARTLGVAAWLTKDRVQSYSSVMEKGPDGFLRSLSYESTIIKGEKKHRRQKSKRYLFDHKRREVRLQVIANGSAGPEQVFSMGQETPSDILTAFYNFRMGAFGPLRPGAHYSIPTYNLKGKGTIEVETLPDGPRSNPFFPTNGLLCRATVDPEIFDTGGGAVLFWFDRSVHPPLGIVEQVIGLGDVQGTARPQVVKQQPN
jgi:hypothetical protein